MFLYERGETNLIPIILNSREGDMKSCFRITERDHLVVTIHLPSSQQADHKYKFQFILPEWLYK